MEECTGCRITEEFKIRLKEGEQAIWNQKLKSEKMDESIKSEHKRTDEIVEKLKDVTDMQLAIFKITSSVETMAKDITEIAQSFKDHQRENDIKLNEQQKEIENLKRKPADTLFEISKKALAIVGVAILSYALGRIGLK